MQKSSTQSEMWTSSLVDTLASHSAVPASNVDRMMTATSGQQCLRSSSASGPLGLLERMLLVTSAWASTKSSLTWKERVTKQGHLLYRLVPSTPLKDAIGVGFWPTPRAAEAEGGVVKNTELINGSFSRKNKKGTRFGVKLKDAVHCVDGTKLNPQFAEWLMGFPIGWTDLNPSETQSYRKSQKS